MHSGNLRADVGRDSERKQYYIDTLIETPYVVSDSKIQYCSRSCRGKVSIT